MKSKDEAARDLARFHLEADESVREIWRLRNPDDDLILLEVNGLTVAAGVIPLVFGPDEDIPYSFVLVEVTPEEFAAVRAGSLPLPDGWTLAERLDAVGAAA